jgi:hypothetical protein
MRVRWDRAVTGMRIDDVEVCEVPEKKGGRRGL